LAYQIDGDLIALNVETASLGDEIQNQWHARLCHQGPSVMKAVARTLELKMNTPKCQCVICARAKAKRKAIGKKGDVQYKAVRAGEALHADVVGKISVYDPITKTRKECPTHAGCLYALIITDEFSHYVWVFLLHSKDEASIHIKNLIEFIYNKRGKRINRFHSDGGGEFINKDLENYFKLWAIHYTQSPPNTPQLNGLAERMNRTMFEMTRCVLLHAACNPNFWGEALLWAMHVYNSTPHPVINFNIPSEVMFLYTFKLDRLRVWGCDVLVLLNDVAITKVTDRTWKGVLIGWNRIKSVYRVLRLSDRRVMDAPNIQMFLENEFSLIRSLKSSWSSRVILENDPDPDHEVDPPALQMPSVPCSVYSSSMGVHSKQPRSSDVLSGDVSRSSDVLSGDVSRSSDVLSGDVSSSSDVLSGDDPLRSVSAPNQGATDQPERHSDFDSEQKVPEVDESSGSDLPADPTNNDDESMMPDDDPERVANDSEEIHSRSVSVSDSGLKVTRFGRVLRPIHKPLLSDLEAYGYLFVEKDLQSLHHEEADQLLTVLSYDYAELCLAALVDGLSEQEPVHFKDAIRSEFAEEWWKAMKEEIDGLIKQGVFVLVKRKKGMRVLKGRWVYKIKLGPLNEVLRRKARFVVKGFLQRFGQDYFETHSPVARVKSIKLILSMAAYQDLELHQMDFVTAFLNALVEEEIYMEQPEGFNQENPGMVFRLKKSLYGLKQASRNWNKEFHNFIIKLGYTQLKSDPCVYVKVSKTGRKIILGLYVDDSIIAFHKADAAEWHSDKGVIGEAYPIKDLGECEWILNMKITRDRQRKTIELSQEAYIERLVKEFGLEETRAYQTPAEKSIVTSQPSDGSEAVPLDKEQHERYRSLVGALLYAANTTRLDIAFQTGLLARYVAKPCRHHLRAAHRVLTYLKLNPKISATFGNNKQNEPLIEAFNTGGQGFQMPVDAYSDADWAGCPESRRSTSGGIIRFNGDIICWISKKQKTIAMSSAESEYIALTETAKEIRWIQQWVGEISDVTTPGTIKCDNRAAILLSAADGIHERTKHFDLKVHFIRDQVAKKNITLSWVSSQDQQADILTKPLERVTFLRLRDAILKPVN